MSSSRLLARLYKLPLLSGLIAAAPVLLWLGWYGWSAFAELDRYRRAAPGKPQIDVELYQLALHDELYRDLRRLVLRDRPAASRLPTYELSLSREALDDLEKPGAEEGEGAYVRGLVRKDGEMHEVRVRLRGEQHWHRLGRQRSMKVQLDKGDLLDGTRVFNLINDPTPFGLEDQIVLDLARELDLLTPEYHPAWVRLNNHDLGVFRYAAQPVEGLLRRAHRMPGSIFSGDSAAADPKTGVGALFSDPAGWQQVAAATEDQTDGGREIDRLLGAVKDDTHRAFAEWAAAEMDLEKYALFDALDVVFGGDNHDYQSNHKLYFDPYTARFEPIAWSFRGFQQEEAFNLLDHPLLIRLKFTPGYLVRRNRAVYELLHGKAAVPEIRARSDKAFELLADELAADPYWDAYKLLPRASRFHRFLVRPMSRERWLLSAKAELKGYAARAQYLLDALEKPGLALTTARESPTVLRVDFTAQGEAGYAVRELGVAGRCEGTFDVFADADRDGRLDPRSDPQVAIGWMGEGAALTSHRDLLPGAVLVAREPHPKRGQVRAESEARVYRYFVQSPCAAGVGSAVVENLVTGGSSRLPLTPGEAPAPAVATSEPVADRVPAFAAGERSPHPWELEHPAANAMIVLGPGAVRIVKTREFPAGQTVRIAAGTRLELAPEASLVFLGRLLAEGTSTRPIEVVRADPSRAFGGVALLGRATAGSRLAHVRLTGSGRIRGARVGFPGAVNIHDTSDVTLEDVEIAGASDVDDVVHAVYVDGLRLHEVLVRAAPTDGVDLEFSTADARGLRVLGAGDDCLDLMGSKVRVGESVVAGCTNNAISAGEETDVQVDGSLIARARIGVLAKNASRARLTRSAIFGTTTALKTNRREKHYAGRSAIGASELFAVDCEEASDEAKGTRIDPGSLRLHWPQGDVLEQLRTNVLGLSSWEQLDASLREQLPPAAAAEAKP